MTSRSYFGKMNSILGSVVPLAMFLNLSHLDAKASMELLCSLSGSLLPLMMFTPDAAGQQSNYNLNVNANNFNFNISANLHHLKWRIPARFCCQHASGRGNPEEVQVHQVDFSPFIMDIIVINFCLYT